MPDDEIITEQGKDVEDTPTDESSAFNEESETDELEDQGLIDTDKEPEKDKDPDEEEDEPEEDPDEEEEPEKDPDDEEEEDEDLVRGKELLEDEEKKQKEHDDLIKELQGDKEDDTVVHPLDKSFNEKDISFIASEAVPKGLLPDSVELPNGTTLDFKGFIQANPEVPVMIAAYAHNIVEQMIANGVIMTEQNMSNLSNTLNNKLFINSLTNSADGVPNAQEIYKSEGFQKWFKDQDDNIKALMRSSDYKDHARVFKRYLKQSNLKDADKKIKEIDDKQKEAKKVYDDIHKSTVKNKKPKAKATSLSPREEETEGFNSDDDDDDFYL
jgi:hypothetical protein